MRHENPKGEMKKECSEGRREGGLGKGDKWA